MKPEFEAWLAEVKGISPEAPVPRKELESYFSDFAEDFNTVTLPHEKFYSLEKWERAQQALGITARSAAAAGAVGSMSLLDDAAERQRRAAAEKRQAEMAVLQQFKQNMGADRIAALNREKELQLRLQHAHKTGDVKEAERIQRLLDPEGKGRR
jgi:hypothetical protein